MDMQRAFILLILFLFFSVSNAMARMNVQSVWRSYTGINVVNEAAVGDHDVWFATNAGLLQFNKNTHSWRRYTIDDGLPALNIVSVALSSRNKSDIFFAAVNPYSPLEDDAWMGCFSSSTHKVAYVSIPFPSIAPWMTRLTLTCTHGRLSLIKLMPSNRVRWMECDESLHHWTEKQLSLKQQKEISLSHPSTDLYGIREVIPSGKMDYIVCENGVGLFDTIHQNLTYKLYPEYAQKVYSSIPFHFRASHGGLEFDRIDSRPTVYGIGATTFRRYLQTYFMDHHTGKTDLIRARALHPSESKRLLTELTMVHRLIDKHEGSNKVTKAALDGRFLWILGDFRPMRFDTQAKKWFFCSRAPDELPLGQNLLIDFEQKNDALIVPANWLYQYRYDERNERWIQEKRRQSGNPSRWLKVSLPPSPLPNTPSKTMWGLITEETSQYRWIIFGAGIINKSPGFPDPYTQPPARVDRLTGSTRFFHELWGYSAYRIIPYGQGDAWIMAKRVSMNMQTAGNTILFRYDSKTNILHRYDRNAPQELLNNNKIELVATTWGALLSLTHGFPDEKEQKLLMAWNQKTDRWGRIDLPTGWRLRKTFGEKGVLAMLMMSDSPDQAAFWCFNSADFRMHMIVIPPRYNYFQPNDLYVGKRYLWFGGLYLIRASKSVIRSSL
jgi:hypothetical protein